MEKIREQGEPPALWVIAGLLIVVIVGFFDWVTNPRFAFTLLYLVPLFLTAGRAGRVGGALVAGASAVAFYWGQASGEQAVMQVLANIWNSLTTLTVFMVMHELLYLQRQARGEQAARDWIDPVSGAGNAKYLFQAIQQEMSRAKRFGRPFSVVYLDIDGLRAVNEKTGHLGGDALLGLVARTVARNIRQSDVVARVGGDEFALLLPETDADETHPVTDRLTRVMTEIFEHDGWPASLTMGVATFITTPDTVDAAVKEAEGAMYAAKESKEVKIAYAVYPGAAVAS